MTIYHYSSETKECLWSKEARENPLEPGNFLIPANSTTDVPPIPKAGQVAIYDGEWSLVVDHRGEEYWDKVTQEKIVVDTIEYAPPANLTDIEPPAPPTELHILRWNELLNDWEIIEPTAQELEAKRIEEVNQKIAEKLPDMLRRGISHDEMIVEVAQIDEDSKKPKVGEK